MSYGDIVRKLLYMKRTPGWVYWKNKLNTMWFDFAVFVLRVSMLTLYFKVVPVIIF